VTDNEAK